MSDVMNWSDEAINRLMKDLMTVDKILPSDELEEEEVQ